MLFPRNALASGPQACFLAEKGVAKVKGGMPGRGSPKTGKGAILTPWKRRPGGNIPTSTCSVSE